MVAYINNFKLENPKLSSNELVACWASVYRIVLGAIVNYRPHYSECQGNDVHFCDPLL